MYTMLDDHRQLGQSRKGPWPSSACKYILCYTTRCYEVTSRLWHYLYSAHVHTRISTVNPSIAAVLHQYANAMSSSSRPMGSRDDIIRSRLQLLQILQRSDPGMHSMH